MSDDKILAIGKERVNLQKTMNKLIADIKFLKDRISKMQSFTHPNKEILNTYEEMLENREQILGWLEQHASKPASRLVNKQ